MTEHHTDMEKFKRLGLSETTLKALETLGFSEPTEIQEKTIPLVLAGKDVIGGSATGSGKTLAFGVGIIEQAPRGKGIQALIITPTRELAEQVGRSLRTFSRFNKIAITMVYGGVALGPQVGEIATADVVVGTPGRILDHLERGTLNLRTVKTLILDEADRMLDMGFIEDVDRIISQCPKERQTFLFSATINADITHIAKKYLKNPVEVSVEGYVDPSKLKQIYYDVPQDFKFSLLVNLLKHEHTGLVMVFCNTRRNTDFVAHNLQRQDIEATAIHGGLTQARRNRIMDYFHQGKVIVLVCTDVAARGLDIKGVSHIYNYDIPPSSKEYIHRIGRTARAGKDGIAISIVSSRDYENFRNVLGDSALTIKQEQLPEIQSMRVQFTDQSERFSQRGRRFGRADGRFNRPERARQFGNRAPARSQGRRFGSSPEFGRQRNRFGNRGFDSNRREVSGRSRFSNRSSFRSDNRKYNRR